MFHHLKRGGSDWIRKSINGKRLCVLPAELYVMLEVYTRRRLITGVCEEGYSGFGYSGSWMEQRGDGGPGKAGLLSLSLIMCLSLPIPDYVFLVWT